MRKMRGRRSRPILEVDAADAVFSQTRFAYPALHVPSRHKWGGLCQEGHPA